MGRFARLVVCTLGATGLVMAAACTPPTTTPPANQAPNAVATADPTTGAAPLVVSFDGSTSTDPDGTIASHSWNFGDGDTGTGTTIDHTYDTAGSYTAVLTVTDNKGRTDTAPVSIEVIVGNTPPTAVLGATPTTGTAPLAVAFSSASTDSDGTIVSTEWEFGDGGTSSNAAPSHTYTAAGLFVASLTVSDDDGATSTDTVTITVDANQPPTAVATAAPTSGKVPLVVAFEGSASTDLDSTLLTFSWAFGDGGTSTQPDPSHTYTAPGEYTAVLTVGDNSGNSDTASVVVTVNANVPPTAVANVTPSAGQAPLTVTFSSASSVDPDGTIVSRSWDFGDGNSSSAANPTYTYSSVGTHTATLTVTDNDGASDTDTVTVEVTPIPNVPPTAAVGATPTSGKEPLTVAFSSAGSSDSDGTITTYSWDFGDGGTSTQQNPSHTYLNDGTYVATLMVTDNAGGTDTETTIITVTPNQLPTAQADGSPLTGKEDLTVAFSSAGSTDPDGSLTYGWDFGDGATSTAANPSHTYTDPGTHLATLTVTDDNGATATDSVTITVIANQLPVAAINATPQSGRRLLAVSFSSAASADPDGTIASYAWAFGDGGTSTAANPSHTYDVGTHTAVLTVTDDSGATDTESITITVIIDDDGDGFSPPSDCNDSAIGVNPGAADPIDGSNLDSNCDGADGVAASQLYVKATGGADTSTCGTTVSPCATIPFAESRGQTIGRPVLLVAGGTYARFTLLNGFQVRGGFGQNFLRGTAATGTTVTTVNGSFDATSGLSSAVLADNINTASVLADLTVQGANESASGRASYGLVIRTSTSALTVDTVAAKGGVGGAGTAGSAGSSASQTAATGGNPGTGGDDGGVCSTSRQAGGSGAPGAGNGGAGGQRDTSCPFSLNATAGQAGGNASVTGTGCGNGGSGGGPGGIAGNGVAGQTGCITDGSAGTAGTVSNGVLSGNAWTRSGGSGGSGTLGANGAGGGGGGGGGGSDNDIDDLGAGGGGGGAGGVAASAAGGGGTMGHASIAIFLFNASPTLSNVSAVIGTGGAGGAGGSGGLGQPGGSGGAGGAKFQDGGGGGNGGTGGRGGNSGGGGGGVGGPAIGVLSDTTPPASIAVSGGTGGLGGLGGTTGVTGQPGATGPVRNTLDL